MTGDTTQGWEGCCSWPCPYQPRFVPITSVVAAGGLDWLVPGVAFSLVVAVVNAWVLLVEVVR
jgi:hypothetical protein